MAGGMGPPAPNAKTKGDNCMTVKRNFIYLWLPVKNEILYIREISGSLMSGERESYNEPHYYYKRYAPEDNESGGLAIVSVGEIPQDECGNKQRLNEAVQDILEYIYGTWDFSKVVLLEEKKTELDIVLYSIDGPTVARKECEIGFTDEDHLRLEALLDGPGNENLENGLISYISPKTRLIGLTIRDGIAYVQLSKDFLSSKDIDNAKKQIEETLSLAHPELRVGIIIDDELI